MPSVLICRLRKTWVVRISVSCRMALTREYRTIAAGSNPASQIVDLEGNVREHDGIINFTIGQRRGLDGWPFEALYVVRLEPETHRVVAGSREALAVPSVKLSDVNWLSTPFDGDGVECAAKIRSTMDPEPARLGKRRMAAWKRHLSSRNTASHRDKLASPMTVSACSAAVGSIGNRRRWVAT